MRKRLTQVFPCLLPLRQKQRTLFFYHKLKHTKNMAMIRLDSFYRHEVTMVKEKMINENSGFDIQYQYNKVDNLKMAAKAFNGLIIYPHEIFSFWHVFHQVCRVEKMKDGLVLVDDKIIAAKGGGLCQLSNLLFKAFLHTPLTIVERHGHDKEAIPPVDDNALFGIDATVAQGWLDLKVRNDTDRCFQLNIYFDTENIYIKILSDHLIKEKYHVINENITYEKKEGQLWQSVDVVRISDQDKRELLYRNKCIIAYEMPKEV
ncbi:MAG: VanW family protein [Erysipelotrichaceae bacterium]|nr:VanW family protein [Erysipelotrichaceae bacterium]MDY5252647.1 VanW family protein [Erysipelotrichaceae bacterium]